MSVAVNLSLGAALGRYFKNRGFMVYGHGKLYHPNNSPPNNDFPRSWTEDQSNPYYWGNGPPIGDAFGCYVGGKATTPISDQIARPLWDQYRSGARSDNFGIIFAHFGPFLHHFGPFLAGSSTQRAVRCTPEISQPVQAWCLGLMGADGC